MKQLFFIIFICIGIISSISYAEIYTPVSNNNRHSAALIRLTGIGEFGLWRKDRPQVPGHFHTGIDIKRPTDNYMNEPIFPIADGVVISKRADGPFAQIIIEHQVNENAFWTVYEHISGIMVSVGDMAGPGVPIARFMNRRELNEYGWQFDHFHFEILKVMPIKLNPDPSKPERFYNSYSLICYTKNDLIKYFYNPIDFLISHRND